MKVTLKFGNIEEVHEIPDSKVLLLLGELKRQNLEYTVHKVPIALERDCKDE